MGLWSCTRLRAAWKEITDAEFSLWIMFALLIYLQCRWKLWNSGEVQVLIQVFLKQTNCKQLLDIQSLQVALLMRWVKPWNIFRAWYLIQLSRIIFPLHLRYVSRHTELFCFGLDNVDKKTIECTLGLVILFSSTARQL